MKLNHAAGIVFATITATTLPFRPAFADLQEHQTAMYGGLSSVRGDRYQQYLRSDNVGRHHYDDYGDKRVVHPRVRVAALHRDDATGTPKTKTITDFNIPVPIPAQRPVPREPLQKGDEAEQNSLIEKVLTERAYAIRKAEGIREWTCMAESGKQMLSHIEAQFGKVDIQTEGTCANRTIAGTGKTSQHALGKAIDFHHGKGHTNAEIVRWLVAHKNEGWVSGIMTYRDMDHIHVDTGPYHFVALNH